MAEKNKTTSFWLVAASVLTVIYIGFILFAADVSLNSVDSARTCTQSGLLAIWFGCLTLNALGDFLAGAFAPLAFIWLTAAVLVQSQELKAQRAELELTRKEFALNRKVMKEQANFIGQQTKLLERAREEQEQADVFNAAVRKLAARIKDSPDALNFESSDRILRHVRINRMPSFNGLVTDFIREVSNSLTRLTSSWEADGINPWPVDADGFRRISEACDQSLQFYEDLPLQAQIDAQTYNLEELQENLLKVNLIE